MSLKNLLKLANSEEGKNLLDEILGEDSKIAGGIRELAGLASSTAHKVLDELFDQNHPLVEAEDLWHVVAGWADHDTRIRIIPRTERAFEVIEDGETVYVTITAREGGGSHVKINADEKSGELMRTVGSLLDDAAYRLEVATQQTRSTEELRARDKSAREREARECPSCGTERVSPEAGFCPSCGYPLLGVE